MKNMKEKPTTVWDPKGIEKALLHERHGKKLSVQLPVNRHGFYRNIFILQGAINNGAT